MEYKDILIEEFRREAEYRIQIANTNVEKELLSVKSLDNVIRQFDQAANCLSVSEILSLGGHRSDALRNAILDDLRSNKTALTAKHGFYPSNEFYQKLRKLVKNVAIVATSLLASNTLLH